MHADVDVDMQGHIFMHMMYMHAYACMAFILHSLGQPIPGTIPYTYIYIYVNMFKVREREKEGEREEERAREREREIVIYQSI